MLPKFLVHLGLVKDVAHPLAHVLILPPIGTTVMGQITTVDGMPLALDVLDMATDSVTLGKRPMKHVVPVEVDPEMRLLVYSLKRNLLVLAMKVATMNHC